MSGRQVEPRSCVTLVLGGARSGKSEFAEALAQEAQARISHRFVKQSEARADLRPQPRIGEICGPGQCVYVATAESVDDEMARRIDRHRIRRGSRWRTVEAPVHIAEAIRRESTPRDALLVDCLTVWLGNLMHHGHGVGAAEDILLESLAAAPGPVVLVANEVGLGIVPDNAMARAFRDHAGRLNQAVARAAGNVWFVAAGIPMFIKGTRQPV